MKLLLQFACVSLVLAGTVAGGWLHGQLSNRWGVQPDSKLAAQRLRDPLPTRVGAWQVRSEAELEDAVLRMLHCPAHVSRIYEHDQTGDSIAVVVLLGPSGPIAVHTPEICYSSQDYAIAQQRTSVAITDGEQREHTLWEVRMKSKQEDGSLLRVLYGWSTGDSWLAAENPRFGYGGVPHLYKIQLVHGITAGQSAEDFDPGQDFLRGFVVQLREHLVNSARP